MRKVLLIIISLLFIEQVQAQSIRYTGFDSAIDDPEITYLQGSWSIDKLITEEVFKEYLLFRSDNEERFHYGNNLTLNPDGTFLSAYNEKCGNDIITTNHGSYEILNEDYICFILEKESKDGYRGLFDGNTHKPVYRTERLLNLDLGLFHIKREDNKIQLSKSDDDLVQ